MIRGEEEKSGITRGETSASRPWEFLRKLANPNRARLRYSRSDIRRTYPRMTSVFFFMCRPRCR